MAQTSTQTSTHSEPCYLRRLSPELRLLIYEHLWAGLEPAELLVENHNSDCSLVCISTIFPQRPDLPSIDRWPNNQNEWDTFNGNAFAILQTCKLICNEATPVARDLTHFDVQILCHSRTCSMPAWMEWDGLLEERARSVSVQIYLFTGNTSRYIDHGMLLAQVEDLNRRLPKRERMIRRPLWMNLTDGGLLTEKNLETFERLSWSCEVIVRIDESLHNDIMEDAGEKAMLEKLLSSRQCELRILENLSRCGDLL